MTSQHTEAESLCHQRDHVDRRAEGLLQSEEAEERTPRSVWPAGRVEVTLV